MATISFSGSGFSYDIDLYGFPAGSLVTIAFSSDNNPSIYSTTRSPSPNIFRYTET